MRNTPISPDEHEELEKVDLKEEKDPNFRLGKVQATLRSPFADEFRDGEFVTRVGRETVEFKVRGYHDVKTTKKERCSLGHEHNVVKKELFIYEAVDLPREKAREFALWLLERTGGLREPATKPRPTKRSRRH